MDPKTYLGEITDDEIKQSIAQITNGYFKILTLNYEYSIKIWQKLMIADLDGFLDTYLEYLSNLEDRVAEMVNTPLYAATVNAINRAYMNYLSLIQNMNSAVLHSLGLVSRKDVVALSEAYVDLKGDIKRESRKVLQEIAKLKEELKSGGSK
ncbi:MAG: hypothetical protein NZ895_06540 [Archaeoglobaceae archaeon]|nr:hypothetical protein [Archaeoglobaceae archaeon]